MTGTKIQDLALGRWHSILPAIGINREYLTGRHGPCPFCQGTDRWRWDNKGGRGTWFCSHCGAGTGVDLVMRFKGVQFLEAKRLIEEHLPSSRVEMPAARGGGISIAKLERLWLQAIRLDSTDLASRYLASRALPRAHKASQLRFVHRALYRHEDGSKTEHPALLARIQGTAAWTLHWTFLDEETGGKAALPKVRKLAPGKFPEAGSVRLSPEAETMGVAEGIETALSAARLHGMPVWATTSAIAMAKWKPPPTARNIVIFADADANYSGQHAAYALAQSLTAMGYGVDVEVPKKLGTDWNDVLISKRRA